MYRVKDVRQAKEVAAHYLSEMELDRVVGFGLPELDDRYHVWRVPLVDASNGYLGEVVIDARTSLINVQKSTQKEILENRLLGRENSDKSKLNERKSGVRKCEAVPKMSYLRNTVGAGDSLELLKNTPNESVDLIFTSPPYYNARPEYSEYYAYEDYLSDMRAIFRECGRVLNEGRFIVVNISPVLVRRKSRSESSKRLAVPFDFHALLTAEGFDFVDDVIWVKPEGAGWATGRGRRFAADRSPLQYKPVPVTEYVLVYRKKTDKLIDWHIRRHPDPEAVEKSKIPDGYEKTNIWKIHPAFHPVHPAVFPLALAEKVIAYYSFVNDVVLDPFAGTGTVGKAAVKLGRRFVLYEKNPEYVKIITDSTVEWFAGKIDEINFLNLIKPEINQAFLNF